LHEHVRDLLPAGVQLSAYKQELIRCNKLSLHIAEGDLDEALRLRDSIPELQQKVRDLKDKIKKLELNNLTVLK